MLNCKRCHKDQTTTADGMEFKVHFAKLTDRDPCPGSYKCTRCSGTGVVSREGAFADEWCTCGDGVANKKKGLVLVPESADSMATNRFQKVDDK